MSTAKISPECEIATFQLVTEEKGAYKSLKVIGCRLEPQRYHGYKRRKVSVTSRVYFGDDCRSRLPVVYRLLFRFDVINVSRLITLLKQKCSFLAVT